MAAQICPNCDRLFEQDDLVKAVVISRFVALKSSRTYAISKPTDCLEMIHLNCNFTKTGEPSGD